MSLRAGRLTPPAALLGALLGGAIACNVTTRDDLYAACKGFCSWLDDTDLGFPECRRDCMSTLDDAREIADTCSLNYILLVECVAGLPPEEADEWLEARGTDTTYPCRERTGDFVSSCPDLWFTARGYVGPAEFW